MTLQERAQEILDDIYIPCPFLKGPKFAEKYIITIKSNEVICWPFDCLTCPRTDCRFLPKE